MTISYSAAGDAAYAAAFLVLPALGLVLLAFGVRRLLRRLRGVGEPNPRYDIVLRGSRTATGRESVIDGSAMAMIMVGAIFLGCGAIQVVAALTA